MALPTVPAPQNRVDGFLELKGTQNPFWIDLLCNPRRVKGSLFETLHIVPESTKLYLNGKLLTDETTPLVKQGAQAGFVIRVEFDEAHQQIALMLGLGGNVPLSNRAPVRSEICLVCKAAPPDCQYTGCGHIAACQKCVKTHIHCPVCFPLSR
jgi:hypothetical protein